MRNFSMKKLGTPSGAGPGWAKLNVGFVGVGTPSGRCMDLRRCWRTTLRSSIRLARISVGRCRGVAVFLRCPLGVVVAPLRLAGWRWPDPLEGLPGWVGEVVVVGVGC